MPVAWSPSEAADGAAWEVEGEVHAGAGLPGATWWYADAPYGRDAGRRDWRPGAG